ncbi:unnamed protein product [Ectocarpus sp. 12 AP-2014]
MVSSSTSAVMILFTSFTATTSFVVFGLLTFKRPSFIILSIASVVALSAFLMGINGLYDILHPTVGGDEEHGICSVGV